MYTFKNYVVLISGRSYQLQDGTTFKHEFDDFKDTTLHGLVLRDGTRLVLRGGQISHFTHYQVFSFRLALRKLFGRTG